MFRGYRICARLEAVTAGISTARLPPRANTSVLELRSGGKTSGMDLAFAWGAAHGRLRAGGADVIEEDGGGFVAGVLGDEFAFEGFVEDGVAESGGAGP